LSKSVIIAFLGNIKFDARCLNMAETLSKSGFMVTIINEKSDDIIKSDIFNTHYIDTKLNNGIRRYWNFHCKVQALSNSINPDIFIAGDLFSLAVCANQNQKCIKIYDSRELYSKLAGLVKKPFKQLFWSMYEQIFYKKINKVIVTAKSDKTYLINKYGEKEIEIIYNFPNSQIKKTHVDLRKRFNISPNYKIFIYQGAIQIGRGIDEMINLLTDFKECVAVIIGEGEYKIQLEKLADKIKVHNRVFFIGNIPYNELLSITNQADIGFSLIQPISQSYIQALPNKLFEYGLAGIPTISSDFPELKKYTENYNLGLAVNPTNYKSQLNAVSKLLSWTNRDEIKKTVEQNFTWESQVSIFLNLMKFN